MILSGSPRVLRAHTGRACGEPDEIALTPHGGGIEPFTPRTPELAPDEEGAVARVGLGQLLLRGLAIHLLLEDEAIKIRREHLRRQQLPPAALLRPGGGGGGVLGRRLFSFVAHRRPDEQKER